MIKLSDLCILVAIIISFGVTGYLWFKGDFQEAIFAAIWVPTLLGFGAYFKLLGLIALFKKGGLK